MNSSLALAIILTFVGLIIFILISKDDLGVTYLKKDTKSHSTLLGSIATGFPGSNILKNSPELNQSQDENSNLDVDKNSIVDSTPNNLEFDENKNWKI